MLERLANEVRRITFERSIAARPCTHAAALVGRIDPTRATCAPCDAQGIKPAKLRMCLTCGTVGCCDSSPERHARAHFEATGHPVMRSIEPGESWAWCYPDSAYLSSLPRPS